EGRIGTNPDNCSDNNCGKYRVTVRDASNNAIAGSTVLIDFGTCVANDFVLSCDQLNAATGQNRIASSQVTLATNALGQADFQVQGGAKGHLIIGNPTNTSAGVMVNTPCASIYADGVLLTSNLVVSSYDINLPDVIGAATTGGCSPGDA